jgi:hypothetical protein
MTAEEIRHELETNAQSILGYVVRWEALMVRQVARRLAR